MMRQLHSGMIVLLSLGLVLFWVGDKTLGADFPEKSIRVIAPYNAGSGTDMEARGIAPYIQKHLGVQVIIENVPGADSKIGVTRAWKARPDGYTLIIHTTTQSMMVEILLNAEYRTRDFSHIYSWSVTNQILLVHSEGWKTFDDLVKAARAGTLSVGIPGRGTSAHLSGLILVDALGIKVNWIPFDSGGAAVAALAGKHIDFSVVATTVAPPLVKAGKLRPLLMFAGSRDMVFPDVPLARDLGYKFTMIPAIRGIDGPPHMDSRIIKVLEQAVSKAVKEPDFLAWAKDKIQIVPCNHEEYGRNILDQQKAIEQYKGFLKTEK